MQEEAEVGRKAALPSRKPCILGSWLLLLIPWWAPQSEAPDILLSAFWRTVWLIAGPAYGGGGGNHSSLLALPL